MLTKRDVTGALDALDSGTLLVTLDGRVEFCDATVCDAVGYDRDALRDSDLFETLVPEERRPEARRVFRQHVEDPPAEETWETPVVTAGDGGRSIAWLDVLDDGAEPLVVGRVTDREPPHTRSRYEQDVDPDRTLVDNFPNGLVTMFDEEFRYRVVGGSAFDDADIAPEDLRGERLSDAFPAENVAELRPLYRAAFEGEMNSTTVRLDGQCFDVTILPVRDSSGDVVAGMTVSQDVTERIHREQELREARDRYASLIEDAPVPVIVCEPDGTVLDLNGSAVELTGRSRDELVGESVVAVHPDEEADRYEAAIRSRAAVGGTRRYLPDGDQIYVVDESGNRIPVEITATVTEWDGQQRVHAIFRDISDYVWHETALEELHVSADDLVRSETESEIAQSVVDAATDGLDLELVSVHRADAQGETLSPLAHSDDIPEAVGDPPQLPFTDSIAGSVFLSNEAERIDDVRSRSEVFEPDTAIRSQLIAPIGEFGVIICAATETNHFSQEDLHLLELLARHAESVFTRVTREQKLRRHERTLEEQTKTLRRVEELNSHIRALGHIATQSQTRTELEQQVCDHLSSSDPFVFAWIGELSPEGDELRPRTRSGRDQGYLDEGSFALDDLPADPAVRTARTTEPTVVDNTATDVQREPWRREAIRRDFSSAVSVPISFQGVLYGVLTLYAEERNAPTDRIRDVLADWGEFMGYAIKEIEQASALLSHRGNALHFEMESELCPLLRVARDTNCTLLFEGIREPDAEDVSVFVRTPDCEPEQFLDAAGRASVIASATRVGESQTSELFQLTITDAFIASTLARYGIRLERIVGDDDGVRIHVVSPPTIPVHRVVEIVSTEYPGATLLETEAYADESLERKILPERVLSKLTERQRQSLELAYHGGYFESPKERSGAELADEMDISSSSFNTHLRAAERTLLEEMLGRRHTSL